MDDLVLRVKQIGNYPFAATAEPTDALLIQQGGLGGSYAYINPAGITGALSARIDTLQIQLSGFNQTVADLSSSWTDQFNTMIAHITDTTVWSFNGRRGDVGLTLWDIVEAGGASAQNAHLTGYPTTSNIQFATQTDSQIANTEFVQRAIAWRTKELLTTHPFVFAWNGRIGRVCMTFDDVEAVLRDGNPTVPDQLESDFSGRVANTRFVQRLIDDVRIDLDALEKVVYAEIDANALATKQWVEATFAPLNSPAFSGYATAPTQPFGTNNATIATTSFVMSAIAESVAGVATWNGRSGNVVFDSGDLTGVGGALINSPAFTGSPTAPTQPTGTSNTTLATTAFVLNEISAIDAGVVTFNNRSGAVTFLLSDVTGVGGAPIASPNFSGTPTAVTATAGTSTTQLATTAFVTAAVAAAAGVSSFEGRTGAVTLTANDISARGGALLASPTFTGVPLAPTAAPGTSTQQLATTAFVMAAIAVAGGVASFNGRAGAVTLTGADITNLGNIQVGGTLGITSDATGQTGFKSNGYITFNSAAPDPNASRAVAFYSSGNLTGIAGRSGAAFYSTQADTGFQSVTATTGFASQQSTNGFSSHNAASSGFVSNGAINGFSSQAATTNGFLASSSPVGYSTDSSVSTGFQSNSSAIGFRSYNASNGIQIDGQGWKPGGGTWSDSSDARIKNVKSVYGRGLAEVEQLDPVVYTFKGNDTLSDPYEQSDHANVAKAGTEFIGLVAQRVEQVMPEMVTKRKGYIDGKPVNDLLILDFGPLTFALINAVKELAARIAALETA